MKRSILQCLLLGLCILILMGCGSEEEFPVDCADETSEECGDDTMTVEKEGFANGTTGGIAAGVVVLGLAANELVEEDSGGGSSTPSSGTSTSTDTSDSSGTNTSLDTDPSVLELEPPEGKQVLIESGRSTTTSSNVSIRLIATDDVGVTGYFISEVFQTPTLDQEGWVEVESVSPLNLTTTFELSEGSGDKSPIVWFRDAVGNISVGISSTISLVLDDNTAPTGTLVRINQGAAVVSSISVSIELAATDAEGVSGVLLSESSTRPNVTDDGWQALETQSDYSGTLSFTLNPTNGTRTVFAWFRDEAGNISDGLSDSVELLLSDNEAPQNPSIASSNGNSTITLQTVSLDLSASDNEAVTHYFLSESSDTPELSDSNWVEISPTQSFSQTVTYELSAGDGEKTVTVWFRDASGNLSDATSLVLTLAVDETPPNNTTITLANGAADTSSPQVSVSLVAVDSVGVTGYILSENNSTPALSDVGWVTLDSSQTLFSLTTSFNLSATPGSKTVFVWFRDEAGNISTVASDSINFN